MGTPSLSIVIPAYNESARLTTTLPRVLTWRGDRSIELLVVDDGSEDDTVAVARSSLAGATDAHVIEAEHRGKGAAVRVGMLAARGDIVGFMDADLATDLGDVAAAIAALDDADVVVGSRSVEGSVVHDGTRLRALMGRGFNRMVRMLARLDVHDSQCGFKLFRRDAARLLFSLSEVDGFAFDAEVLHAARVLDLRIAEIPVTWTAMEGSSVRPVVDSFATGRDLLRMVVRARPSRVRAAARAHGWVPRTESAASPTRPPLDRPAT